LRDLPGGRGAVHAHAPLPRPARGWRHPPARGRQPPLDHPAPRRPRRPLPRSARRRQPSVRPPNGRGGAVSAPDIAVLGRFSLAGKVALVTGASGGLGAGFAVALAQAGPTWSSRSTFS